MRQSDFHRTFSGISSKIWTFLLGFIGILSTGCDNSAAPTYGPPGIYISGTVRSFTDSSAVAGIEMRAATPNSIMIAPSVLTDQDGEYLIYSDDIQLNLVDSLIVGAFDTDGSENGSYVDSDTTFSFNGENSEIFIDFYMEPKEKE